MGMDFCIGTDRDPDKLIGLGRGFTYALFDRDPYLPPDYKPRVAENLLGGWLSAAERKDLFGHSSRDPGSPEAMSRADPALVLAVLRKLRARLEAENDRLPVTHFLKYLDGDHRQPGGYTTLHVPSDHEVTQSGFDGPIARLEGAHEEAGHRMELRRFRAWIDPADRERHEAHQKAIWQEQIRKLGVEPGQIEGLIYACHGSPRPTIREEPEGWLPVQVVVEVLGRRIGVRSVDKQSYLGPDLDRSIECAERAVADKLPFYWNLA